MDSLRMLHAIASIEEQHDIEIDVAALDRMYRVQDIMNAVRAAHDAALPNTDLAGSLQPPLQPRYGQVKLGADSSVG